MRARLINEIKRGIAGSELNTIGIGSAAVTRFYDEMKQNWPDDIESMFNINRNSSDYITYMAYRAAKILNCNVNQIKYSQKSGFGSNKLLDKWVETLTELSHEEPIILNGEDYNDYDQTKVKYIVTINPVSEWDFVVVTKKRLFPENTSQTNYLIKTPLR